MIAEAAASQRERERYAPPETGRTTDEALQVMMSAIRRREAEPLAIEAIESADINQPVRTPQGSLPLAELAEAGAEQASSLWRSLSQLSSGPLQRQQDEAERHRGIER